DHAAVRDCRRGERHFVERVLAKQLELRTRLNDEGVAIFTQQKDLAVVSPRRRGETAGVWRNPLPSVDLASGPRVMTEQEPSIEQRVVVIAVDERGGLIRPERRLIPHDLLVGCFAGLQ